MFKGILAGFLLYIGSAHSAFYQTCKWSNQTLTDRFIKSNQEFLDATRTTQNRPCDFSAYNIHPPFTPITDLLETEPFVNGPIPSICFLSSTARGSANGLPTSGSRRKYYHCRSPNDDNPIGYMPVKNPQGKIKNLYLRSPCLSEDYHSSLVKTFNKMAYCFGLSQREARNLFAVINHESHFIPNAKSPSGARCTGQLTKDTVNTLTANTLHGYYPEFHLYESAQSKCPSLVDKTIPPDIFCTKPPCSHTLNPRGSMDDSTKPKLKEFPKTCKLTSNLPQCFFYTFLNFKTLLKQFDQNFRTDSEFGKNEGVDERFIDIYGSSVGPNEIMIAETSSPDLQFLFTSTRSAYRQAQKYSGQPNNPMYDLNVKRVPLISPEDLDRFKYFSIQMSYNGGSSVVRSQVKNFLKFFKQELKEADCPDSDNKYCEYRKRIAVEKKPLDLGSIKQEFKKYLKTVRYRNKKTGKMEFTYSNEMFRYPRKIQSDVNYFQNSGLVQGHLTKLTENPKNVDPETRREIQETAEAIKRQCQFPNL